MCGWDILTSLISRSRSRHFRSIREKVPRAVARPGPPTMLRLQCGADKTLHQAGEAGIWIAGVTQMDGDAPRQFEGGHSDILSIPGGLSEISRSREGWRSGRGRRSVHQLTMGCQLPADSFRLRSRKRFTSARPAGRVSSPQPGTAVAPDTGKPLQLPRARAGRRPPWCGRRQIPAE